MEVKNISAKNGWSLFLDRDGVINEQLPGLYVNNIRDFKFLSGVYQALAVLSRHFKYVFIVTNQQGIGKGYMNSSDLEMIHSYMITEIEKNGGRIDAVYYCPELESSNPIDRKPNPGMGIKAKADFPEVVFTRSVMVGDSASDIKFGQNLGMQTVFLNQQNSSSEVFDNSVLVCKDLFEFACLFKP